MSKLNRRILFTDDARFAVSKPAGDTAKPATLTGYAIVYNTLSSDRGGYKVRLLPGSATFELPALALFQHDYRAVIGNTENGSLRFVHDDHGVKVEIDLPDTNAGRDTLELVTKKYVRGMSFAMVDLTDAVESTENGETILNVSKFTADEVTITPIPSFTETTIDVKRTEAGASHSVRRQHALELDRLRLAMERLPQ